MKSLITGLIFTVLTLLSVSHAKETNGHILTDESWHYLDTFCVDGNSDEAVFFNFEIEYIMRYFTHVQKILIYNDKEWPRLTSDDCSERLGPLDTQHQINLTASNHTAQCDRIDPKIPGVRRMFCKGSRQLTAADDVKWYIATSNCNATIPGVELWYRISITRKGGGSADFCHNKLRNKLVAVAITLGVLLVLIYIAIAVLYFTKWRNRPKPNENNTDVAQTYSVHPNAEGPSSSNYGYVPDSLDNSRTHADYQHTDDTDLDAVVNSTDANSIPIRFPTDPLTGEGIYSRESNTDEPGYSSRNNFDNPGYGHYQRPRVEEPKTRQLWHNPSFLSDMSEEPKHNTDNYQRYLWNKMRDSPQISNYTDNTYDEIENQQQHALAMQNYGSHRNEHHNDLSSFHAPAKV